MNYLPVRGEAVVLSVHPGCVWARFTVNLGLGAVQGQRGHAVIGPEKGGAERRAQGGAVGDGRPAVANHRRAVESHGSMVLAVLVAAVRVRRRDADGPALCARRRAVPGSQDLWGARSIGSLSRIHFLKLVLGSRVRTGL